MLEILKKPNEILHNPCEEVKDINAINPLIVEMKDLIDQKDTFGLGLAAPQIGQSLSFFVMRKDIDLFRGAPQDNRAIAVINPVIKKCHKKMEMVKEGCLSVPGEYAITNRFKEIEVEYYDEEGTKHKERLRGTDAIVFQHEYNHLSGITMDMIALKMVGIPVQPVAAEEVPAAEIPTEPNVVDAEIIEENKEN